MNILVTGANGQLGSEMRILAQYSKDTYVFTDVSQVEDIETIYLDITDLEAVRATVAEHHIDAIVNCAAYTNVDASETNEVQAEKLNADAPENLAIAMKENGGLLVHVSTDYVYGAEPYNTPLNEDQKGAPTGVYGMTKLQGEKKIIAIGCNHVIIRTAWLYSEFGKNFCKTMMNLTAIKPQLNVVIDQVGTPTYALDLARVIEVILSDFARNCEERNDLAVMYPNTGVYHYSNEGVCSWFDFSKMIAEYCGNTGCDIHPCHSDEYPSPVKRPSYSVLDKKKIKTVFGVEIPYWTDSLKKCINNLSQSK